MQSCQLIHFLHLTFEHSLVHHNERYTYDIIIIIISVDDALIDIVLSVALLILVELVFYGESELYREIIKSVRVIGVCVSKHSLVIDSNRS